VPRLIIAPPSAEFGAGSKEPESTDAKGPPTHHATLVDVTYFRVSVRIRYARVQLMKAVALNHLFLSEEVNVGSPGPGTLAGSSGRLQLTE
jgi:hypothetical protein